MFNVRDYRSNSGVCWHFLNADTIVVVTGNNNHLQPITPPAAIFELLVNNIPALRCLLHSRSSAPDLRCDGYIYDITLRECITVSFVFLSDAADVILIREITRFTHSLQVRGR